MNDVREVGMQNAVTRLYLPIPSAPWGVATGQSGRLLPTLLVLLFGSLTRTN